MTELPRDIHVRRTGEDYANAFLSLLPTGQAWPRHVIDSVLVRTAYGLNDYWGYVDGRAADLLEIESDPRKTVELLPDWERNWGLPDPCYEPPLGILARQLALVQRMTMEGGQSRQFFIDVIYTYTNRNITISEYRPWMVGVDVVGDGRVYGNGRRMHDSWHRPIVNPAGTLIALSEISEWPNYGLAPLEVRYYWRVHINDVTLIWFRCSAGECGIDPHLRIDFAEDVECLLERWKPAHTKIIFDYSEPTFWICSLKGDLISGPADLSDCLAVTWFRCAVSWCGVDPHVRFGVDVFRQNTTEYECGYSIVYTWFRCAVGQCGIDPHLRIGYQTEIGHLNAQSATLSGTGQIGATGSGCLTVAADSAEVDGSADTTLIEGVGYLAAWPASICASTEMGGCQYVFSQDLTSLYGTDDTFDLSGYNVRVVLDQTLFVGVPVGLCRVSIRLVSSTEQGFTIDAASFGQRALTGEVYDIVGCIAKLQFNGQPGVIVAPGESVTCDEFEFDMYRGVSYVLAVHFTAGGARSRIVINASSWLKKAPDETNAIDVSGYSQPLKNALLLVDKIDVCPVGIALSEVIIETAAATETVDVDVAYSVVVDEPATATDVLSVSINLSEAMITETAAAADVLDATVVSAVSRSAMVAGLSPIFVSEVPSVNQLASGTTVVGDDT